MNSEKKLPVLLDQDQGFGILSARALWAALVGPHLLPMASIKIVKISGQAVELKKSLGASDGYVFLGVGAPPDKGDPGSDRGILLGPSESLGNGSWPAFLVSGAANRYPVTALLMPGEQLFVQSQDGSEFSIVVAAAIF